MIALTQLSLAARWRRQLGRHGRRTAMPRPLAALDYLTNGAVVDGLIEIENLVLVVLYDELDDDGRLSVNVAGYAGARVPWGVQWGGLNQNLFLKNLLLRPRPRARGRCLDTSRAHLLELTLQLDRHVDRYTRYLRLAERQRLVLPRLWAGFKSADLVAITADGPELEAAAKRSGKSLGEMLHHARRDYEGLSLLPLEWVSHHWQRTTAVFADLSALPKHQVMPLRQLPDDLHGFQGAAQYDFYSSRFRTHLPDPEPAIPTDAAVAV